MKRLIDATPIEEELFKLADKALAKNPYEKARICAFRGAFEMVSSAPTVSQPPNAPLTLEELREMEGEPVYLDFGDGGEWALVRKRQAGMFFVHKNGICSPAKFVFESGGQIYRRKPEEGAM